MKIYKFKCKDCGATKYNRDGNTFKCQYCGYTEEVYGDQPEELKSESSTIEPKTVVITNNTKAEEKPVNLFVIMIVCFIAGYAGVHKFMEGKIGMGFLYMVTGGLFGIGYIADCISYFFKFLGSLINKKSSKDTN